MKSLGSIPSYWWLMALASLAIVIGLGIGLWRTKTVKLLRAIKLENRGMPLLWNGYHEEAKALLTKSLRLAEEAVGPDDAEVGPIVANLAQVYWFQGNFREAEHLYQRAIAVRENAVGPEDPFLAAVLNNLAKMYRDQGRDDEAAPLKERANSILEATPYEKKPKTIRRGMITGAGFAPEPPEWQELMDAADAAEDEDKA
ncbi:MAG: tetratricopeptide repeat protein, partial [Dongiaceae bacterium]